MSRRGISLHGHWLKRALIRGIAIALAGTLALPGAAVAAPEGAVGAVSLGSARAQQQLGLGIPVVGPFTKGTVVSLRGTSHLWFADELGVLHWGGDTRAIQGKAIRWDLRVEVSLEQLKTLPRGAPWLHAGLLKLGDPIYFVKWETEWAQPQLLHIQSIKDVELFGIDGSNYGTFVMERAPWETKFNLKADALQKGTLASAATAATPVADQWREQTTEGGFLVYLPRTAQPALGAGSGSVPLNALPEEGIQGGRLYGYSDQKQGSNSVSYFFGHVDVEMRIVQSGEYEEVYGLLLVVLLQNLSPDPSTITLRETKMGDHEGLDIKVKGTRPEPTTSYFRFYRVGTRLYFMDATMRSAAESPDDAARFLDSLKVTQVRTIAPGTV